MRWKEHYVSWMYVLSNQPFCSQEVAMWSAMPNCPSMYGVALPSTPAGEGLSPLVMCYPHSTPPQGAPLWAAPQPNLQLPWVGLVGVTWYLGYGAIFPADWSHTPPSSHLTSSRRISPACRPGLPQPSLPILPKPSISLSHWPSAHRVWSGQVLPLYHLGRCLPTGLLEIEV